MRMPHSRSLNYTFYKVSAFLEIHLWTVYKDINVCRQKLCANPIAIQSSAIRYKYAV